jgi:hypothetical protein
MFVHANVFIMEHMPLKYLILVYHIFALVAYLTVEPTLFEETSTTKLFNCFIIQSSHSFHMHNQIY